MKFFCFTSKSNTVKYSVKLYLYPYGSFKEMFSPFCMDWGHLVLSVQIRFWYFYFDYRYGRKIPKGIPRWAR